MSDESEPVPSSKSGGARSGFASAVKVAPQIVQLLPNADRFAGLGLLAVLTLFGLALWLGPKATTTGELSQNYLLILLCVGAGSVIVLVLIGVLGRTKGQPAPAESVELAEPAAAEAEIEAQAEPAASSTGSGLELAEERSIYRSEIIEVIRGYDETLQRPVAKKVLLMSERRQDFVDGAREAIRIADLPHFTGIYAAQFSSENPYILMQFIEGGTLCAYIEAQGETMINPEVARRIVFNVGEAIFRAHQASVRLGNIKASNILLDERDEPYISPRTSLTFVNAKQLRAAMLSHELSLEDIVYTAPELLSAEHAMSARGELCDQYALGILAYELLTSSLPPTLPTIEGLPESGRVESSCRLLIEQGLAAYRPPPPVHELRRSVPTRVGEIIQKMMAVDPEQRYPRLDHALAALRSVERTILLTVRDSYVRCLGVERDPTFLECFYELFVANELIAARFEGFSKERWTEQHGKLQGAIEACFDFAQVLEPKLDIAEPNSMTSLARLHGPEGLHISAQEYELFVEALVRTVCGEEGRAPYDLECEDAVRREPIARAWRELLVPIIAYFARA